MNQVRGPAPAILDAAQMREEQELWGSNSSSPSYYLCDLRKIINLPWKREVTTPTLLLLWQGDFLKIPVTHSAQCPATVLLGQHGHRHQHCHWPPSSAGRCEQCGLILRSLGHTPHFTGEKSESPGEATGSVLEWGQDWSPMTRASVPAPEPPDGHDRSQGIAEAHGNSCVLGSVGC